MLWDVSSVSISYWLIETAQKMALFIYPQLNNNSDAFTEQYASKNYEYNLRHANYNKERTRTNYASQKTTYLIPDFLSQHPAILTFMQSPLSAQFFKQKKKLVYEFVGVTMKTLFMM